MLKIKPKREILKKVISNYIFVWDVIETLESEDQNFADSKSPEITVSQKIYKTEMCYFESTPSSIVGLAKHYKSSDFFWVAVTGAVFRFPDIVLTN